MPRRRGNGLFEAFQIQIAQEAGLFNSKPAPPREETTQEKAQRRKQALAASFEKEYREREEKRERESKEAQAAGRRNEIFGYMKSDAAERKQFARCNPDILEAAIIEWRKLGNPSEGLVKTYGLLIK